MNRSVMEQSEVAADFPLRGSARLYEGSRISLLREIASSNSASHSKNHSVQQLQLRLNSPVQLKELDGQLLQQPGKNCVSQNVQGSGETPRKQKRCSCKNSRCLKLYCDCFASGTYCDDCKCINCLNNDANGALTERNLSVSLKQKVEGRETYVIGRHTKGCNCRKSGCLKRYCECFHAKVFCSVYCTCICCKNIFESSEVRSIMMHELKENADNDMRSPIGTAIRSPNKKPPSSKGNFQLHDRIPLSSQDNNVQFLDVSSPKPTQVSCAVGAVELGPSKLPTRPLSTDLIGLKDVKDFCSHLVVDSMKTSIALGEGFPQTFAEQERTVLMKLLDFLKKCDDTRFNDK